MCTSIRYQTENGINFLARTMDFGYEIEGQPIIIPRNYHWELEFGGDIPTKYGYVGTGRRMEKFMFADGVNECGLAMVELYFPNEAKYESQPVEGKINLAPHELLSWVLGEISNLAELKERISELVIVAKENPLLGNVIPLHYMITDETGESIVIEPDGQALKIKENPIHVMTNSPEIEWHIKNLNNYIGLQPHNFKQKTVGEYAAIPFGQGSGTFGLPGGYTSPERFVRAAYLLQFTSQAKTTEEGVMSILHILGNVSVPKGTILDDEGDDYTQYRSILNTTEKIYYLNNHDSNRIVTIALTEDALSSQEPTIYHLPKGIQLTNLN